jgi:N-acetylglucosamine-6-phosphate deacetylase
VNSATLITGARVLAEDGVLERGDILIEGRRIARIARRIAARGAGVVRAKGLLAAPGLIDIQINGGFGYSFSEAVPEQVALVARRLASHGVTAVVPTLISLPEDVTLGAIRRLVEAAAIGGGARILGIHLEGPFLSPERRGAHREENLRPPSLPEFRRYAAAARGLLRMMTLAPELPGALAVVREGARRGILMSAGHSTATAEQMWRAVERGVRHVTHVFNAMAPLHHREETLLNVALVEDRVSCGMIYDRHHLGAATARLLLRAKAAGTLVLVSDATAALEAPEGELIADGERYWIERGQVRVRSTGRLAGSAASLLDCVRSLVEDGIVPPERALPMAAAAPARLLGLRRKGTLRPGADADVVLLDAGLRARMTFVEGELLHGDHH